MNRSIQRWTTRSAKRSTTSGLVALLLWLALAVLIGGSTVPACLAQEASTEPTLMRVRLTTEGHPGLADELTAAGFDVLRVSPVPGSIDLIVSQQELNELTRMNLAATPVDRGRPLRDILRERSLIDGLPPGYLTLDEIIAAMADCAAAYPSICEIVDLTERYQAPATYEGRHLWAVRISDNIELDEDEPAMLIVGNHHAREIVTPVIGLYAMEQLTSQYGSDPDVTAAVDSHEIWIAPTWNPDGYTYVFEQDNYWRKNRAQHPNSQAVGIDQNRNYPFGWSSPCSGSTNPYSATYKGPSPASESETQTMMLWSVDRYFSKVIDYHSYGREVLFGYTCRTHPLAWFLESEAFALASDSGYGDVRTPSADGEHFQWQLGMRSAHAFLIETHVTFQPTYDSALAEAALLWPGILSMAGRPASLTGHVTDADTGLPIEARIRFLVRPEILMEQAQSEKRFGRYSLYLPAGQYRIAFMVHGYDSQLHDVTVTDDGNATVLDIALAPRGN